MTPELLKAVRQANFPFLPGIETTSEAMYAREMGFKELKLFPANVIGAIPWLASIKPVFPDLVFCATGGVKPGDVLAPSGTAQLPASRRFVGDAGDAIAKAIGRRSKRWRGKQRCSSAPHKGFGFLARGAPQAPAEFGAFERGGGTRQLRRLLDAAPFGKAQCERAVEHVARRKCVDRVDARGRHVAQRAILDPEIALRAAARTDMRVGFARDDFAQAPLHIRDARMNGEAGVGEHGMRGERHEGRQDFRRGRFGSSIARTPRSRAAVSVWTEP